MSRLRRTNGEFYTSVPNNTILGPNAPENALKSPINLIGRNKVSYGEAQNENFLWLTENFAGINTPQVPIKGQLWYDLSNDNGTGSGGELKIAPIDNAPLSHWLTVPVISEMNIEPSQSHTGRMIIYKKDRLKIRMDNSWHQLVTEVPQDKLFSGLLDIKNTHPTNTTERTTILLNPLSSVTIARFNEGGYLKADNTIGGTNEGVLRYNSVYQWEADIIGRAVDNSTIYKIWKLKGSFSIATEASQVVPRDPRKITAFDVSNITQEVIYQNNSSESWTIDAVASPSPINYNDLSPVDILDGEHFGLVFNASLGNSAPAAVNTQWSVMYRMTGIPGI